MSENTFAHLGLPADLIAVLDSQSITTPTEIQRAAIPDALSGRDLLGRGRTGSGKTLAFVLPMLTRLLDGKARPKAPRALILVPTRELAGQIEAVVQPFANRTKMRVLSVYGGVGYGRQIESLRRGVDVLIACPGRLADLISQGACTLSGVRITVLDEADQMSDMGFLPEVKRLLNQTPEHGQRLLFSATLDGAVGVLVKQYLKDPATHEVDTETSPVSSMAHHVLHVDSNHRYDIIHRLARTRSRTVIFTRTKFGAKKLAERLNRAGIPTVDLHGNLSQNARTRNLKAFADGDATTLVATDVAARGIHVDDVTLVIHADPPTEHKAYLHRSGRTARAGAHGTVVTLMQHNQTREIRALTRAAGIKARTTRVTPDHPLLGELSPGRPHLVDGGYVTPEPPAPAKSGGPRRRPRRRPQGAGGSHGTSRPRRTNRQPA